MTLSILEQETELLADAQTVSQVVNEATAAQTTAALNRADALLDQRVAALEDAGIEDALNGDMQLTLDLEPETIPAAELNAGAADTVKREFQCRLTTEEVNTHAWARFTPVLTEGEAVADGDVGAPTAAARTFEEGLLAVPLVFDTDAGATKTYQAGAVATGSIDCDDTGTDVIPADTEDFLLDDGINLAVTFRFNLGTAVVETDTLREVDISAAANDDDVRDAIITAVANAPQLFMTASNGGAGVVDLVNDVAGTAGNVAITDTVADVKFAPTGMASGVEPDKLTVQIDISAEAGGAGTHKLLGYDIPDVTKTYVVV